MAKRKRISTYDLIPPEAWPRVDEIAYTFLCERGYDTVGATASEAKRQAIEAALRKNGEEMCVRHKVSRETGGLTVWFEIYKDRKRIASSTGLKILPAPDGEGGRDGGENGEDQERTAAVKEDHA